MNRGIVFDATRTCSSCRSKKHYIKWFGSVLLCLLLVIPFAIMAQAPEKIERQVIILHTNDQHFQQFPHLEALKELLTEFRDTYTNVLLLDGGDITIRQLRWEMRKKIVSNEEQYIEHIDRMIKTMNLLGYDAVTLGNHDLDYQGTITRDAMLKANFPFLGANVEVTTPDHIVPEPYIIRKLDGDISLIVLGLCGGSYGNAVGIKLKKPLSTFEEHADFFAKHDARIVLAHIGDRTDKKLAEKYGDKIQVIIGGHTHPLRDPPVLHNDVLLTRSSSVDYKIKCIGVIRLTFDPEHKLVKKEAEILKLEGDKFSRSEYLKR